MLKSYLLMASSFAKDLRLGVQMLVGRIDRYSIYDTATDSQTSSDRFLDNQCFPLSWTGMSYLRDSPCEVEKLGPWGTNGARLVICGQVTKSQN